MAWNLPEQQALEDVKEAIIRREALAPFETSMILFRMDNVLSSHFLTANERGSRRLS